MKKKLIYSFNGDSKEKLFVATINLMRDLKKEIENLTEEIIGIIREEEEGEREPPDYISESSGEAEEYIKTFQ